MLRSVNSLGILLPPLLAPSLAEPGQSLLDLPPLPPPLPTTPTPGLSNAPKPSGGSADASLFDDQGPQGPGPTMGYHERQGLGHVVGYCTFSA